MQKPKPGEYVAVAAIIGVMAAIIYPFASRFGPHRKRGAICADHMRVLGIAFSQYAQDYDRTLPQATADGGRYTWRSAIDIYVRANRSIYMCYDREENSDPNTAIKGSDGFPNSYAVNAASGDGQSRGLFSTTQASLALTDVPSPESMIAACEVQDTLPPVFDIDAVRADPNHPALYSGHGGTSAYLFADGHTDLLSPAETVRGGENAWYVDMTKPLTASGHAVLFQDRS